jgi:vesicle coat complex subunit
VNLSDIQLDIMDYIRPAECKAEDFRGMWAEFEWENKVSHDPLVSISRTAVVTFPSIVKFQ